MKFLEKLQTVIQHYDFTNVIVGGLTLIACILLELTILPFRQTSLYKFFHPTKSIITDLIIAPLYLLGIFGIIKGVVLFEANILPINLHLSERVKSPFIQFFVYLLIFDFLNYWVHRIHHHVEFLWQIHKFHHSADDFILITGNRIHPLEKLISNLALFIPLRFLGAAGETYLLIIIVISFIDEMQHSMVKWNFGWLGKHVFFSPVGHRIHHSKERDHWDKNFGDIFVFWDKLFGTYYYGTKINSEIGVTQNWYNRNGVAFDLVQSTYLSVREFINSVFSGQWKARHLREGDSKKMRMMKNEE